MSTNLHKNLNDLQLHVPKGFSTAANSTKLTKNASGNLDWVVDSAGTSTEITTTSDKGYGDRLTAGNYYSFSPPSGNNEHKFTLDLGNAPTTITPKNAVGGSILTLTKTGETMSSWTGKVYGGNGLSVNFHLLHVPWGSCQQSSTPITFCTLASTGAIALTGNNNPICFDVSSFNTCSPSPIKGDLIILVAEVSAVTATNFTMTQTIRLTT